MTIEQKIEKLTIDQRIRFYILLGKKTVNHFNIFDEYPANDFNRMVDHLIEKVKKEVDYYDNRTKA